MNFLKKISKLKQPPISSYQNFWEWFKIHEKKFHSVIKNNGNIEKDFFSVLAPKLNGLMDGFYFLTGMADDKTVELIISVGAKLSKMAFAEELIAAAPAIDGWKFKALIPPLDIKDVNINTSGYQFNKENLSFYSNEDAAYPDEINIVIIHKECTIENKSSINFGVFTFLDNYLGESTIATCIDNIEIFTPEEAEKELIPIEKLRDFISWRRKEFVEKYDGVRVDNHEDNYAVGEFKLANGNIIVALVNTDLLKWEAKASYPWSLHIIMDYDGSSSNGMPRPDVSVLLDQIEDNISIQLPSVDGFLQLGRQTGNNRREIFFACADFRKPSKILDQIQKEYSARQALSFEIQADKYWNAIDHLNPDRNIG